MLDHLPKPGHILLDANLLNLNSANLQNRLNELGSTLRVVLLASYADITGSLRAVKAGAADVLSQSMKYDEIVRAIQGAMAEHYKARASKTVRGHHHHVQFASMTPCEQQVFRLVVRGNANKQIAHQLGTTVRTVKAHRKGVMEKMRVKSLAELVSIAVHLGEVGE